MNQVSQIIATPWNESAGTCDCCGQTSKTIWGDLSVNGETIAVYYVQWTTGSPTHYPNIDLIVGPWGEDASPQERVLISLLFRPSSDGGSFMVVDSESRPANNPNLCVRALRRVDVIGTPLAQDVFAFVDAIWLTEPRITEVKELNHVA